MINGMAWMLIAPAKTFAVVATIVCCVLVYSLKPRARRACGSAPASRSGSPCFFAPMFYLPWSWLAAAQSRSDAGCRLTGPASLDRLALVSRRACFPAARLASMNEGAFGALRQAARLPMWSEDYLRAAGPQSLAFVTSVQPRGLPRDWRAQLVYTRAELQSGEREPCRLAPDTL